MANNTFKTPLYDVLREYAGKKGTPFHMPGHKLGKGVPARFKKDLISLDITELPFSDNLHNPEGVIMEAQKLAAQAFGADYTLFLVNGSTGGIHAAIMSVCHPGDRILVARNCHSSIMGGLMLAGAKPVYVLPEYCESLQVPGSVTREAVAGALDKNPDAIGMIMVCPTYYGICSDIRGIAEELHSRNKVLIVDEAHGAHLAFSDELPASALQSGADISVQSAHKTLPALTPGAFLHVKSNRVDLDRVNFFLKLLQTTSPSYITMAFLDIARAYMQQFGQQSLKRLAGHCSSFREKVNSTAKGNGTTTGNAVAGNGTALYCPGKDLVDGCKVFDLDPTRLVINVKNMKKTGYEVEKKLSMMYNIHIEMADCYNVLAIATVSDRRADIDRFASALLDICNDSVVHPSFRKHLQASSWEIPEGAVLQDIYSDCTAAAGECIDLKDVFKYGSEKVDIGFAAGRISRGYITPYPPGIPVVCPGEVISHKAVEYVKNVVASGGRVVGIGSDNIIDVLKVER